MIPCVDTPGRPPEIQLEGSTDALLCNARLDWALQIHERRPLLERKDLSAQPLASFLSPQESAQYRFP